MISALTFSFNNCMVCPLNRIPPPTNLKGPSRLQTEHLQSTDNHVPTFQAQEPSNVNVKRADANTKSLVEPTAASKSVRVTSRVEPKELSSLLSPPKKESQKPCSPLKMISSAKSTTNSLPRKPSSHNHPRQLGTAERLRTSAQTPTARPRGWGDRLDKL